MTKEEVLNTKSTSVVQDVIEEISGMIAIRSNQEMEEYSLYQMAVRIHPRRHICAAAEKSANDLMISEADELYD